MLFVGDQVIYEGNVYKVFKVNGDIINIANEYSEAEAFEEELTVVYEPDFEPFDYGYMLDNERIMLRKMHDFFSEESMLCDKDDIARHIGLAINLLNIILAYDDPLVMEYNDSSEYKDVIGNASFRITVYVNTRNAARFLMENINHPILENELRKEKAWYLYHKIRFNYLRNCWE